MGSNEALKSQLKAYKQKFYKNKAIKGSILLLAFMLSFFVLTNTLEFCLVFLVAVSPRIKIRLEKYFKTDNVVTVKRSGEYIITF